MWEKLASIGGLYTVMEKKKKKVAEIYTKIP